MEIISNDLPEEDEKQPTLNDLLDQTVIEGMLPESDYRFVISSDSPNLNLLVTLIEKRFIEIEEKVFKKNRISLTTKAQQMLLLKHLGILKIIDGLNIKVKQKAMLLSSLLNASADNIEGDLSQIRYDNSPLLTTKTNYEFLENTFRNVGLSDKADEMLKILDEINKRPKKVK